MTKKTINYYFQKSYYVKYIYLFIKIKIKNKKTVKQKTLFPKILLMRIRSNAKAKILVHKLVVIFVTIIYLTDFKWSKKVISPCKSDKQ